MNINRHNYEEFFILYMDNELNDAEKQMVEAFVQNNPDLKDELDILLQSKLIPDNSIVFEDKEELMKIAESSIDLTNYEEWLTLYIDDELSIDQKKQVDAFIAAHPQIQNEFSLLQKTKFQPEEIVFPYKESLYRRTEKVRVVQMRWWRVAAAAILLLAIGTTVVLVSINKKQSEGPIVKTPNNEVKSNTNNTATTNTEKETAQPETEPKKESNKINESNLANSQVKPEKNLPQKKIDKKEESVIANNAKTPSNDLPEPLDNPNTKRDFGIAKTKTIETNPSPTDIDIVTKSHVPTSEEGLTFAKNQESNTPDLEEGQNKSSRGIFRKAVRFFEKTTGIKATNDDDKVLIGGLAVKLK